MGTVYHANKINIQRPQLRFRRRRVVDVSEQISLLCDTGIGEDDVDVSLLCVDLLKGRCLAFPGGDVALDEGQASGRVLGAELVEERRAVVVYIEDCDVRVWLGGEVAGDAQADA